MKNAWILFTVSLIAVLCGALAYDPVAAPAAIIKSNQVRFTVLTSRVIRMEFSENNLFNDKVTLAIVNRNLPVPRFTSQTTSGYLTIKTDDLVLTYKEASGRFSATNLNITLAKQVAGKSVSWTVNSAPTGNLLGTIRTLDTKDGAVPLYCPQMSEDDIYSTHCQLGLISRDGWAVYNDSKNGIFTNDTWPWIDATGPRSCDVADNNDKADCNPNNVGGQAACLAKGCCYKPVMEGQENPMGVPYCYQPAPTSYNQDLYFFGHGHDYFGAMKDFSAIAGSIPVLPRYIFGPQYSRWHAFDEVDEVTIIDQKYAALQVPLDTLVLDMDWHYTYDTKAPACNSDYNGWTGYTWDRALFPNPDRFLAWVHHKGLRVTNNMHPAAGVQCAEEKYALMAQAVGVDPKSNQPIYYQLHNKTYAKAFMDLVLAPLHHAANGAFGIDYWWIDYQQGEQISAPNVNPTFWVNYVFSTAQSWWGANARPVIMARWGGLGNHRLSTIGFSGDVATSWASLAFQPYFTTTASNVGFFWSHDLGGFYGQPDGELYVRWIQWGLFSNMLRTHCYGKQEGGGDTRDIWEYDDFYFSIMRKAFVLRSQLIPYIYSQHVSSHETGVGLLRGLYFYWPEEQNAYSSKGQYMYGDSLMLAPITQQSQQFNMTTVNIWVPPGTWIEFYSGQSFVGPRSINRTYLLSEIPIFVKSGAIITTRADYDRPTLGSAQQVPKALKFLLYPFGSSSTSTTYYDDDGVSLGYLINSNAITTVNMTSTNSLTTVKILPFAGNGFDGMPKTRSYQFEFFNVLPATSVKINGASISFNLYDDDTSSDFWTYRGEALSLLINLATQQSVTGTVTVEVVFGTSANTELLANGFTRKLNYLHECKDVLDNAWGTYFPDQYPDLVAAANIGRNMTVDTVASDLQKFQSLFAAGQQEVNALSKPTIYKSNCQALFNAA